MRRADGPCQLVSRKDRERFDKLADFLSSENNSEKYRKRLNGCKPPCIPFLGLHLSDLTFINEAIRAGSDRAERDSQVPPAARPGARARL